MSVSLIQSNWSGIVWTAKAFRFYQDDPAVGENNSKATKALDTRVYPEGEPLFSKIKGPTNLIKEVAV